MWGLMCTECVNTSICTYMYTGAVDLDKSHVSYIHVHVQHRVYKDNDTKRERERGGERKRERGERKGGREGGGGRDREQHTGNRNRYTCTCGAYNYT